MCQALCWALYVYIYKEMQVWSLRREEPLEWKMTTCSNILAWKNLIEKGAWRAKVHGVAKSWTWLSKWTHTHMNTHTHTHTHTHVYIMSSHIIFRIILWHKCYEYSPFKTKKNEAQRDQAIFQWVANMSQSSFSVYQLQCPWNLFLHGKHLMHSLPSLSISFSTIWKMDTVRLDKWGLSMIPCAELEPGAEPRWGVVVFAALLCCLEDKSMEPSFSTGQ